MKWILSLDYQVQAAYNRSETVVHTRKIFRIRINVKVAGTEVPGRSRELGLIDVPGLRAWTFRGIVGVEALDEAIGPGLPL